MHQHKHSFGGRFLLYILFLCFSINAQVKYPSDSSFIKTIEFNSYEDAVKYIKDYEQTLGNRYRDRYIFKGPYVG